MALRNILITGLCLLLIAGCCSPYHPPPARPPFLPPVHGAAPLPPVATLSVVDFDRYIDLRVEDHAEPITELARVLKIHKKFHASAHKKKTK